MKMKEKDEKSRIELLGLVEESDATKILTNEKFKQGLNDLMKYELIDIRNDKICITERGKRAQREGINAVISKLKKTKLNKPKEKVSTGPVNYLKYVGILMFILLLFVGLLFIARMN